MLNINVFFLFSSLFFIIGSFSIDAKEQYIIAPAQSQFDASHDYYKTLLQKSLDATTEEYGSTEIKVFDKIITQGRAENELLNNTGSINIHRMGTSSSRENKIHPIRVPLILGVLGHRIFIIHKKNKEKFSNIVNIDQLRELVACQGLHWPDSDILEHAKLKVLRTPKYEAMFKMLDAGRCDYFPRAIHEAVVEVQAVKTSYPDLIIEQNLMLKYDFPMYFFVSKKNKEISQRVEKGLLSILENGDFLSFMKEHPTTAHIFPLSQWKKRRVFQLKNPFLPIETPLNNKKLWLDIGK